MRPLLPAYNSSLSRDPNGPNAPGADADGRDAGRERAGGGVQQGAPEDDAVDDEEVDRLASWLSLFRMLVIFLPLFALCLPTLLGDWERARRNETMITPRRFVSLVTPRGSSLRRQESRTTCRTEACMAAAANVSLDPTVNPCDDLFGHVCNNWIRNHRIDEYVGS
ncbi:uncharacterized protein LOC144095283 [Amblyomma americanum]|uniref:Uncharacterized protein n=1 Tax=Amblyomma americanum TaxID=6943 RepID=A0AAQ4EPI8_AMBAM